MRWVLVLLTISFLGCGLGDSSPAQLVEVNTLMDAEGWYLQEVIFDKTPQNLTVENARDYRLSGKTLLIREGCGINDYKWITVSWQGGQRSIYACTSGGRTSVEFTYE